MKTLKEIVKAVWHWIAEKLKKTRNDRLYHFLFGVLIAAFCCITLKMNLWSILVVAILAFLKESCGFWIYRRHFWGNAIAMLVGGIVIAIFVLL